MESVSGQTIDAFLSERIYKPLAMNNTSHNLYGVDSSRVSLSYLKSGNQWKVIPPEAPPFVRSTGGLVTTTWDFAVFCQMFINGGIYNGTRILSQEVDDFFAANFVYHGLGLGVEEWKQFISTALTAFPDIQFTVEDRVAEGNKVTTRWTYRATHQGDFMGIPATGKQTGINISCHENGKYVEDWDALGLLQQLGANTIRQSI